MEPRGIGGCLSQLSYHFDAIHESMKNVRNVTLSSSDDVGCRKNFRLSLYTSLFHTGKEPQCYLREFWRIGNLLEFNLTPRGHPSTLSYDKYFHSTPTMSQEVDQVLVILKEQTGDTVLMVLLRSQILNGARCHRVKVKITEMN